MTPQKIESSLPIPGTGAIIGSEVSMVHPNTGEIDYEIVLENPSVSEMVESLESCSDDKDVIEDFAERQQLNQGGEKQLDERMEHTQVSPELSAGDLDAGRDLANASGEETLTGDNPTPDQDVVDNEGLAAGLVYSDEEELNSDKVNDRDRHRWELDPRSAQEAADTDENQTPEEGEQK